MVISVVLLVADNQSALAGAREKHVASEKNMAA